MALQGAVSDTFDTSAKLLVGCLIRNACGRIVLWSLIAGFAARRSCRMVRGGELLHSVHRHAGRRRIDVGRMRSGTSWQWLGIAGFVRWVSGL